jgi:hypothetical protein
MLSRSSLFILSRKGVKVLTASLIVLGALSASSLPGAQGFGLLSNALAQAKRSPFDNGPKTIASQERVTVLVDREIADGKSYIALKISVPTDSKINAFLIDNPKRIVVDFEGASIKRSENFAAPENDVVQQVRLGAHPEKLRVVIDLKRTTQPEFDWKAGKRQAIVKILEGSAPSAVKESPPAPAATPTSPAPAALPTEAPAKPTPQAAAQATATPLAPTAVAKDTPIPPTPAQAAPTIAVPTVAPTNPAATAVATPVKTLSDIDTKPAAAVAAGAAAAAGAVAADAADEVVDEKKEEAQLLADLEAQRSSRTTPKPTTSFSIKGYKFEHGADKTPVLKIVLNKPRAQAQISKVDPETYKIEIKDCSVENEDLELPQFPPHDFVGFVMVVSETVGKNVEVSVSVEEGVVLGTTVQENEILVKKP